jgi:glycosyltransferase involved in cell wall biosynthesis
MLTNNLGFRIKYKSRTILDHLISSIGGNGIYNIKGLRSQKDKNALVIYTAEAVSKYLSKTLSEFPHMSSHSGFRESIEILNLLLEMGYTVDYFDMKAPPKIDWNKYQLVIDAGNNLENCAAVTGQKKIFYSTSCHWRIFHENAYKHTDSFYRRNKILLYPDRDLKPNYSDDAADLITSFGGTYHADSFGVNKSKVRHLSISTTHLPPPDFKKSISSKKKFMWYAGYGPFHKGFDLVVEAFLKTPNMELHIFTYLQSNKKLYDWFLNISAKAKNIIYHGWVTPDNIKFKEYVNICDAVVYASSSEGGPGAIIQCLQFGIIPIINKATAIDLFNGSFNITGKTPEEEIDSIIDRVIAFSEASTTELQSYSEQLSKYYCENHTVERFKGSLKKVLEEN